MAKREVIPICLCPADFPRVALHLEVLMALALTESEDFGIVADELDLWSPLVVTV